MANTYSKIYLHLVFAVRNRQSLLLESFREKLFQYMSGVITNQQQKLLIVNGHVDHVHIFIGCKTNVRLDELVKEVKEHSTKYINNNRLVPGKFRWQEGYAAFSVSRWDHDKIFNYIRNQEEHHRKNTFQEEYRSILRAHDVEFDERYIFHDPREVE